MTVIISKQKKHANNDKYTSAINDIKLKVRI